MEYLEFVITQNKEFYSSLTFYSHLYPTSGIRTIHSINDTARNPYQENELFVL